MRFAVEQFGATRIQHGIGAMLEAGITVRLGTDDPPMFQTTLLEEYERAWRWAGLNLDDLARLAQNSIEAAAIATNP